MSQDDEMQLAKALEPFARVADGYDNDKNRSAETPWGGGHWVMVRLADCRKARDVLESFHAAQAGIEDLGKHVTQA